MEDNYQQDELEKLMEAITEIAMAKLPEKINRERYAQLTKEKLSDDVAWLFLRLYLMKELVDHSLKDSTITKEVIAKVIDKSLEEFKIRHNQDLP